MNLAHWSDERAWTPAWAESVQTTGYLPLPGRFPQNQVEGWA